MILNRTLVASLAICLPCLMTAPALGEAPEQNAYVVEEDWALVLRTPNLDKNCPQFSTAFRLGNGGYFLTTWNYRDVPDFAQGGIQVQLWSGGSDDVCIAQLDEPLGELQWSGETVRWTHVYRTNGNDVVMKTVGISAQSWGTNITAPSMTVSHAAVANFNTYDPENSIAESNIGYGKNRVQWFGITEVRMYDDKGRRLVVNKTPRPVFP
jgi:hypothetical protein